MERKCGTMLKAYECGVAKRVSSLEARVCRFEEGGVQAVRASVL